MATVTLYRTSRCGNFKLGAPYSVSRAPVPGRWWRVYASRLGVSATVWEQALSHDFRTRREARAFLATQGLPIA